MIVACQWKRSSPTGPAEHWAGGSRPKSCNSLLIRFKAIVVWSILSLFDSSWLGWQGFVYIIFFCTSPTKGGLTGGESDEENRTTDLRRTLLRSPITSYNSQFKPSLFVFLKNQKRKSPSTYVPLGLFVWLGLFYFVPSSSLTSLSLFEFSIRHQNGRCFFISLSLFSFSRLLQSAKGKLKQGERSERRRRNKIK